MPSTSATIESSGSVQPSCPSSAVPSGQDHRGRNCEESTAAMPMAAVSVRETNRSDHSPYAAVSPQVSPRSAAVASASTRPSPDSISTSRDSRVTAAS